MYFRIMMTANEINAIKNILASPKKIIIIPHRNPDGDAMGSTLGLYHFLVKQNHFINHVNINNLFPQITISLML